MWYSASYSSPIGRIFLSSSGETLSGLWMEGQKYYCATLEGQGKERPDLPVFVKTMCWLDRYFAGKRPAITELELTPEGSSFRRAVWNILCEIPYGQVTTYGEIARNMAALTGKETMSGQAVGGAVSHNPISIIIPCHRVVGAGGSLTGYAGGIDKKIKLLKHEGVDMTRLFVPKKGTAL